MTICKTLCMGCCLLAGAALVGFLGVGTEGVAAEPEPAAQTAGPGCAKPTASVEADDLNEVERRVVDYVADLVERGEGAGLDAERVAAGLGVPLDELIESVSLDRIQVGVRAELARRGFDVSRLGAGNCSRFRACSVDRNLNNAQGDELARYEAEVALDGKLLVGPAPPFELPATDGTTVALADLRGKNVAVVLLSGHCYHSLDTLPILSELREAYAGRVEILPVFVNSGDVEDMKTRAFEWNVDFPLIVAETKAISQDYDSRMVPTTFLVDRKGRLIKKLVGFKDKATLDGAFGELAGGA